MKLGVATREGRLVIEVQPLTKNFVMHLPLRGHRGPYVVTHRRSRLAVGQGLSADTARRYAEALETALDWSRVEFDSLTPEESVACRALCRSFGATA